MTPNVTLLDLVDAVGKHARSEAELIATVVYMVNRGHVRLCGTFKGARFDLATLAADQARRSTRRSFRGCAAGRAAWSHRREHIVMARTVGEHLVSTLDEAGVRRVYGIVGDSLNPVTDAIRRSKTIDWIHVRHEESAAFAAGADAELTGRLAVCAGSCGPGNPHLINGLYDGSRDVQPSHEP
jgi:Thiamine pyrophosphate enzyme, N-terminal TPP binding domain